MEEQASTTESRRQFFKSFEAKSLRSRSLLTQIADDLTNLFGSNSFLFLNILFFAQWVVFNMGWVKEIQPWDPYPFGFLTMVVSLEAIILSVIILVSQNRQSYLGAIREEVHLRINIIAEEEITKILEVLAEMRAEMGIKRKDPELEEMIRRIDTNYIERSITDQMLRANKPLSEELEKKIPGFNIISYPIRKPLQIINNLFAGHEKN